MNRKGKYKNAQKRYMSFICREARKPFVNRF